MERVGPVYVLSPEEAAQRKATLRREMRRRLEDLGAGGRRQVAEGITRRVLAWPWLSRGGGLLVCLSFGLEWDTGPLVAALSQGTAVFVPRADPVTRRLSVHPYPCDLETLRFGLRQPPADSPAVPEEEIDQRLGAALVLGLAFDHQGFRLGHGGGYFDRFFADHRLPGIGLAGRAQLLPRVPRQPHDRRMRALVTDEGIVDFTASGLH